MQAPRLTELNPNEVLLYLGYRGQEISSSLERQISSCIEDVMKIARPRLVYRRAAVLDGRIDGLSLAGHDIEELLSSCHEAIVMAATLGSEAEALLRRKEVVNMADALIIDSAESTAIENVANNFEQDMRDELASGGLFLTDRFSPGYGDLPLETQDQLSLFLDTEHRIGLSVTADHLMIPRKSVTCIMGISRVEQKLRKRGCEVCSMFRSCSYRRSGGACNG